MYKLIMPLTSRSAIEAAGALRGSRRDIGVRLCGFPNSSVVLYGFHGYSRCIEHYHPRDHHVLQR